MTQRRKNTLVVTWNFHIFLFFNENNHYNVRIGLQHVSDEWKWPMQSYDLGLCPGNVRQWSNSEQSRLKNMWIKWKLAVCHAQNPKKFFIWIFQVQSPVGKVMNSGSAYMNNSWSVAEDVLSALAIKGRELDTNCECSNKIHRHLFHRSWNLSL